MGNLAIPYRESLCGGPCRPNALTEVAMDPRSAPLLWWRAHEGPVCRGGPRHSITMCFEHTCYALCMWTDLRNLAEQWEGGIAHGDA